MAKANVATKTFANTDGETSRHANGNVESVGFKFANDVVLSVSLDELPDNVKRAAMAHGISQKVGDAYAGSAKAEGDPIAWAVEQASTVIDNMLSGVWISVREGTGAPRVSMLLVAMQTVAEAAGIAFDRDKMQSKLTAEDGGADFRKAAMANAKVKAVFENLKAEAAAARATAAAEAAYDTADDESLFA